MWCWRSDALVCRHSCLLRWSEFSFQDSSAFATHKNWVRSFCWCRSLQGTKNFLPVFSSSSLKNSKISKRGSIVAASMLTFCGEFLRLLARPNRLHISWSSRDERLRVTYHWTLHLVTWSPNGFKIVTTDSVTPTDLYWEMQLQSFSCLSYLIVLHGGNGIWLEFHLVSTSMIGRSVRVSGCRRGSATSSSISCSLLILFLDIWHLIYSLQDRNFVKT